MGEPFTALRVLEIPGSAAGAHAARLFGEQGAAVERWVPGEPAELRRRIGQTDVLIESAAPDPLVPCLPEPLPDALVAVRISPFGSSGPYRQLRSNAFTDQAPSGHLLLNGAPEREPIARPGLIVHHQAGLHAFIAALAALRVRARDGVGQRVEVSHLESLAAMHQHTTAMWTHGHHVLQREGNRQPGYWHPAGIYPCRDGHVLLDLAIAEHRDRFLSVANLPELLVDPRFADDLALGAHKDAFDAAILPWLLARDAADIVTQLQQVALPVGRVRSYLDVLADPHLEARRFWREQQGLRVPGSALRITTADARSASPSAGSSRPQRRAVAHPTSSPLEGIRVLDLSRVWAGPFAGRMLADLGADVVAVEAPNARGGRQISAEQARRTHLFPDDEPGARPWNRLGSVNELQRNKRGITLDLKRSDARIVLSRLVAACDVVLSNWSPRVVPGMALDFEDLLDANPGVIHCAISGYGAWGPDAERVALGPLIEAASGPSHAMGYEGGEPCRAGVALADPITGLHAVAGILAALAEREADPEARGRFVDVSMLECMLAMCGDDIARAQRQDGPPARTGNRDPQRVPQGVYPVASHGWIAISVEGEPAWRRLCELLELDARLTSLTREARWQRREEIDLAVAAATRSRECDALVAQLQDAGVLALGLSDARTLCGDPQLEARGFWAHTPHPEAGVHSMPGCPLRLSRTPVVYRRPAPRLGEHNREVLRQWAGCDDETLDALEAAGVLTETPP